MNYLQIWAYVFWIVGVTVSTIMNGFAGFLAAALAIPAMICLAIFSVKGGPFGGLGTALVCIVGSFVVAGLVEIVFTGMGYKVFGIWAGFWRWFWSGGYWLTIGVVAGSFVVTLALGAMGIGEE
jgi:hypothetical protein